jgi:hypothetical protein
MLVPGRSVRGFGLAALAPYRGTHPDASIEVGTDTVTVKAREAQPSERDEIWERQKERVPHFAQYEKKAAPRKIPVIVLDPVK